MATINRSTNGQLGLWNKVPSWTQVAYFFFVAKMALHLSQATLKTNKMADVCPQCLLLLDVIRDVLWLGYVFACSSLDFFFFLCSLPTSELFDPPTQLSQCSSGSLSTSLQCAHQRPPCLISYICHTFTNKERQQLVTMHKFFFFKESESARIMPEDIWLS